MNISKEDCEVILDNNYQEAIEDTDDQEVIKNNDN